MTAAWVCCIVESPRKRIRRAPRRAQKRAALHAASRQLRGVQVASARSPKRCFAHSQPRVVRTQASNTESTTGPRFLRAVHDPFMCVAPPAGHHCSSNGRDAPLLRCGSSTSTVPTLRTVSRCAALSSVCLDVEKSVERTRAQVHRTSTHTATFAALLRFIDELHSQFMTHDMSLFTRITSLARTRALKKRIFQS